MDTADDSETNEAEELLMDVFTEALRLDANEDVVDNTDDRLLSAFWAREISEAKLVLIILMEALRDPV